MKVDIVEVRKGNHPYWSRKDEKKYDGIYCECGNIIVIKKQTEVGLYEVTCPDCGFKPSLTILGLGTPPWRMEFEEK